VIEFLQSVFSRRAAQEYNNDVEMPEDKIVIKPYYLLFSTCVLIIFVQILINDVFFLFKKKKEKKKK